MNIQTLNELDKSGILSQLFKAGFISCKIFEQRDIYLWVDMQVKSRGISVNRAVMEAEVKFNKSRNSIYRALDAFDEK